MAKNVALGLILATVLLLVIGCRLIASDGPRGQLSELETSAVDQGEQLTNLIKRIDRLQARVEELEDESLAEAEKPTTSEAELLKMQEDMEDMKEEDMKEALRAKSTAAVLQERVTELEYEVLWLHECIDESHDHGPSFSVSDGGSYNLCGYERTNSQFDSGGEVYRRIDRTDLYCYRGGGRC